MIRGPASGRLTPPEGHARFRSRSRSRHHQLRRSQILSTAASPDIFELIRQQLSLILDTAELPTEITLDSKLVDDLGLGSLEAVSLIMNLEDSLDLELTDDEVANLRDVGDVVRVIEAKLHSTSEPAGDEAGRTP